MQNREQLLERVDAGAAALEATALWAEENGRLHTDAVDALVNIGVPRLYLPASLGGYAVDPVTCALVCEAIADIDTAAAWHVMVFNAARLMGKTWPQELVENLWLDDPDVMVSASGNKPFQGERAGSDAFVVSGVNGFVSGCHHATWMMAPMLVGEEPHVVVLPMSECEIVDNWDSLGLRGSGSNDVRVDAVRVPASQVVSAVNETTEVNCHYVEPLYRCPGRVVFATYVPIALSLARRGLEELANLAENKVPYATDAKLKNRSIAQIHYGKALAEYRSARLLFYDGLEGAWERAAGGAEFSEREKADLYLTGTHAVQACAGVLQHVAQAAGSSVTNRANPLHRILRDMETLRHHGFVNESRYGSVTQVLWGAQLDYPLLLR